MRNLFAPSMAARLLAASVVTLASLFVGACQTTNLNDTPGVPVREIAVDRPGFVAGTGPESQDLNRVADKMLRSILDTPAIATATTPPRVALLPVNNNTRFPINKNIFLKLIKVRLNSEARGRVVFLAREEIENVQAERDLKRQGAVEGDRSRMTRAPKGADYFLTGSLDGMGQASAAGTSDYVLYTFKLIDAETDEEVWEDYDQIKKQGLDDVVYR